MSGTLTAQEVLICAYEEQLRALDERALDSVRAELDADGIDAGYFSADEGAYRPWANGEDGAIFCARLADEIVRRGGAPLDPGEAR